MAALQHTHLNPETGASEGRSAKGRTGVGEYEPVQRGSPAKSPSSGYRALQLQSNVLISTTSPKQRAGRPELAEGSVRDISPQRKQPEQPQRWETSTKFVKAVR